MKEKIYFQAVMKPREPKKTITMNFIRVQIDFRPNFPVT